MKRLDVPENMEKTSALVSCIFYFLISNDILVKFIHRRQWEKYYKMMKMLWNDYGMIILICCCSLMWVPVVVRWLVMVYSLNSFKSLCLMTLWIYKRDKVEGSYSGEGYSDGSGGVYSGGGSHSGSVYTGGDGLCDGGYTGDGSYDGYSEHDGQRYSGENSYGRCRERYGGCSERGEKAYGDETVDGTKEKACDAKGNHRNASDKKDCEEMVIQKKVVVQKRLYYNYNYLAFP